MPNTKTIYLAYTDSIVKGIEIKRILINNSLLKELIKPALINCLGLKYYKVRQTIYLKIADNSLLLIKHYIIVLVIISEIITVI